MRVHCHNGLDGAGTALHSHGIFFRNTSHFDGAVGATQCAIPPGDDLTYEIPVDNQYGTYWIHGHFDGQYVDGLRAPLIVLPQTPRTDNVTWDEDYTIIVGDWYTKEHPQMMKDEFLVWWNPTGAEPVPQSALVYIANGEKYLSSYEDLMSGKGTNDEAVLPFEKGKKYKIRVINMSALAMFHLSFGDHKIQVIETDGVETVPTEVDLLTISVAQRYSLLIEATGDANTNYPVMVWQDPAMYDVIPDDLVLNNTIQLEYNAASPKGKPFEFIGEINEEGDPEFPPYDDTIFKPLEARDSVKPDHEITISAIFETFDNGEPRASFNETTYQMPRTPTLFTQMSMGQDADNERVYGVMTNAFVLKYQDMVQITIINTDDGFHPFHLHGHEFQVVGKYDEWNADDASKNPTPNDTDVNPMRRDTVAVPPNGASIIRFRADNPGTWLLHCHVEWHMNQGLAITLVTSPDEAQKRYSIPQVMKDHCTKQGISPEGNIVGQFSTTDFKGEPEGPWRQKLGWQPKGIWAMTGCVLTVVLGWATVVWYAHGNLNEEDIEEEIHRKEELKAAKGGKYGAVKKLIGRNSAQ